LFSRTEVATFINDKFEAAWESLRPVPIVRIDFGSGNVITRTLHGNIATYVCDSEGEVIDVIPGIYTPDVYMKRLNEMRLLGTYVARLSPERRAETLQVYHQRRVAAAAKPAAARVMDGPKTEAVEGRLKAAVATATAPAPAQPAQAAAPAAPPKPRLDVGKTVAIERPVAAVVKAAQPAPAPAPGGAVPLPKRRLDATKMVGIERPVATVVATAQPAQRAQPTAPKPSEDVTVPEDLANWRLLREDTASNEAVRRQQIDVLLAKSGLVRPATITRTIYKDVLHADLDDPYLGLGQALFGSYPFAKEEKK
jgi:hypothetical protein